MGSFCCAFEIKNFAYRLLGLGNHYNLYLTLTRVINYPKVERKSWLFWLFLCYILVTATTSGILKAKQKLGRTFNSDKLGGIDFTKISKLTMCSA